jgi:hypothetical protein
MTRRRLALVETLATWAFLIAATIFALWVLLTGGVL